MIIRKKRLIRHLESEINRLDALYALEGINQKSYIKGKIAAIRETIKYVNL